MGMNENILTSIPNQIVIQFVPEREINVPRIRVLENNR